jgi:hypothetical protein
LTARGSGQLTSNQLTAVGQAAQVSRGWRRFSAAKFSWGMVCFGNATFSGGTVDFSDAADWSDPPNFSEINPPPTTVVKLPTADQASPDGHSEAPG